MNNKHPPKFWLRPKKSMVGQFKFDRVEIFQGTVHRSLIGMVWHGFLDIPHIKDNNSRSSEVFFLDCILPRNLKFCYIAMVDSYLERFS